jgi:hypothetical protein
MSVEAKAKVKARHSAAISAFKAWKESNPKARLKEQTRMFDLFVDSAKLKDALKR